ncbi:hypothetical protein FOQG_18849 [Fusarium oxysporum f. sp. raphani 54005]|uniref:Uncharacterized protein n=3 Tax=Fusarium oxysporum TaxID=5507 RepID=X0C0S5_FUSOX|nr:uncharacterized protein FOBCDRAFT_265151 [Fusarium oxysporum Fo47]EXK76407.1 hypothetical protein FOQG_18849 [Fusarium oxysporum f. sp. raphani 54005]KAG7403129.1 hypothetical protein Forpi1262_v018775 [Fusarium oxysporum f. sp. raphani]RKK99896.1 hypothetical protein BFJ70_g17475 [Fusarium oxysporum]EWZ27905.1 hypothetical protein FOZG_18392 [Fusarium oxysporum Fo47]WJG37077.1 hypothetical protein FOBCDRAFT_265151 [Fusarium oxysporum Fo47]
MAEISEILDLLWNPPRKRDRHPEMPSPNRFKPEDFGYYKKWGFAIYRTYHGAESDQHWNVLLQALRQQTPLSIGFYESDEAEELWKRHRNWRHGYYKKREHYLASLDIFKSLFRLFPHEDPSHLEGLDINGIREVCRKQHHEANQKMAGAKFCFALVADEAVLDGIARNEFVVKAVGYDWDRIDHGGWGWVRLETGRLLELWEALLLADVQSTNKYYWMKCDGPESDLETDIWTGDWSLPDLDIYSKVQTASEISQLKFDY